jgi:uncharacterized protein (DUF3084 family)
MQKQTKEQKEFIKKFGENVMSLQEKCNLRHQDCMTKFQVVYDLVDLIKSQENKIHELESRLKKLEETEQTNSSENKELKNYMSCNKCCNIKCTHNAGYVLNNFSESEINEHIEALALLEQMRRAGS